jgi:hypothetical protein
VADFSAGSRRRLMRLLASVNKLVSFMPLFLTLTYPGEWPADPARWKRDLEAWGRRLGRKYPEMSAVWRLEPQKRGAPHYHLLVFGVDRVDAGWLARSWYEVVGSGDLRHLQAGTRVERVKSWRGVMSYASKYLAKLGGGFEVEHVGRWWGVWNRGKLPVELVEVALTFKQFYELRRVLRRYLVGQGVKRGVGGRWRGLTVFLEWDVGARLLASMVGV